MWIESCLPFCQVHEVDVDDKEEQEKLQQQKYDRLKFSKKLKQEGFTVETSKIGQLIYTKLHCPFKRLCREAERVKFEMPIKDVSVL